MRRGSEIAGQCADLGGLHQDRPDRRRYPDKGDPWKRDLPPDLTLSRRSSSSSWVSVVTILTSPIAVLAGILLLIFLLTLAGHLLRQMVMILTMSIVISHRHPDGD